MRRATKAGVDLVCAAAMLGVGGMPVGAQSPGIMGDLHAYELAGSGAWRRDNPDPGTDEPSHWVRVSRWGPGGDVVVSDAYAVSRDGRCEAVSHMVHYTDGRGGVNLSVFAAGGVVLEGSIARVDADHVVVELSGTLPDGTPIGSRDRMDQTRPDTLLATAEAWQDGAWVERETVRWVRLGAVPACPRRP